MRVLLNMLRRAKLHLIGDLGDDRTIPAASGDSPSAKESAVGSDRTEED
jgi:hypothetical protein